MRCYDAELLQSAREVTRRHGIPLIFDEVFSGYGRTGPMWASEHAGVEPDLLCIAKGFTAGMLPMAATLATHEVYAAFLGDASRAFFHGHTFCGNPLGARVAREVLAVYRDERVLETARPKAETLRSAFQLLGELPGVENARSLGMVGALELGGGGGYLAESGWRVYDEALRRGAYLRPLGNTVYVAPALNIPDARPRRAPRHRRRVGSRGALGVTRWTAEARCRWVCRFGRGRRRSRVAPPRNVMHAAPWSVMASRVDSRIQPSAVL